MDTSILERLSEQWAVLLVILERLVVQRQIVALLLLALGTEGIARILSALLEKVSGKDRRKNAQRSLPGTFARWFRALEHIWSPLLAVTIGQGSSPFSKATTGP